MREPVLFTDLLSVLHVPHTYEYSVRRFTTMPFLSLFGLSKLLQEYGVDSAGYKLADPSQITSIKPPFLLQTRRGFVIVSDIRSDGSVNYLTEGVEECIPGDALAKASTGVVMTLHPAHDAAEPSYGAHRLLEIAGVAKRWILAAGVLMLFAYFFITRGFYASWSGTLLCLFNLAGLALSFLLMKKSTGFKSRHGDRFCGVLEAGGFDNILKMKSSTFFGIFSWAEVGMTYFSVSLSVLMLFPEYTGYLALYNLCCLPFTCWSIWYQKIRAHHWCTLCVSVQATLWCLFFCYLGGGWLHLMFPLKLQFFVIGVLYVTTLMFLNRISDTFKRINNRSNPYA